MAQINERVLTEIAEKSATAEAFFEYASKRTRNVRDGVSRIVQIKEQMRHEGYHTIPQDLLSMFKELERAGLGELKGDSFKWNVPIREVGMVVTKRGSRPKAVPHIDPIHHSNVHTFADTQRTTPAKSLTIMFASGKEATIQISASLSREEVRILTDKLLQECTK